MEWQVEVGLIIPVLQLNNLVHGTYAITPYCVVYVGYGWDWVSTYYQLKERGLYREEKFKFWMHKD